MPYIYLPKQVRVMRHALTVMEDSLGPNHVDVANHALLPLAGLLGDGTNPDNLRESLYTRVE